MNKLDEFRKKIAREILGEDHEEVTLTPEQLSKRERYAVLMSKLLIEIGGDELTIKIGERLSFHASYHEEAESFVVVEYVEGKPSGLMAVAVVPAEEQTQPRRPLFGRGGAERALS